MGTIEYWKQVDLLVESAKLKIQITTRGKKQCGFKILIGEDHSFEVYEFMHTYFRERIGDHLSEGSQIFDQTKARELYYQVMVDLLDQAA